MPPIPSNFPAPLLKDIASECSEHIQILSAYTVTHVPELPPPSSQQRESSSFKNTCPSLSMGPWLRAQSLELDGPAPPSPVVGPWASHFTSLCFVFLICKMKAILVPKSESSLRARTLSGSSQHSPGLPAHNTTFVISLSSRKRASHWRSWGKMQSGLRVSCSRACNPHFQHCRGWKCGNKTTRSPQVEGWGGVMEAPRRSSLEATLSNL